MSKEENLKLKAKERVKLLLKLCGYYYSSSWTLTSCHPVNGIITSGCKSHAQKCSTLVVLKNAAVNLHQEEMCFITVWLALAADKTGLCFGTGDNILSHTQRSWLPGWLIVKSPASAECIGTFGCNSFFLLLLVGSSLLGVETWPLSLLWMFIHSL